MINKDLENTLKIEEDTNNRINPFGITIILYFFIAILAALQSALLLAEIIDESRAIAWVRIHFITLGVLTQAVLGYTPRLVNKVKGLKPRWDIWISLNVGLVTFFYGRTLFDNNFMITGGTLVFIAVSLFIVQLFQLREKDESKPFSTDLFYIM